MVTKLFILHGGKMVECLILFNDLEEMKLTLRDMLTDGKCRHRDQLVALANAVTAIDMLQRTMDDLEDTGITAVLS